MTKVLIAGIAGASLGTEIAKALRLAGGYCIFGCDISPLAFGHYAEMFEKTFLVAREGYVERLLRICAAEGIQALIPGGDEPTVLLAQARDRFLSTGIQVAVNAPDIIARLANKEDCFRELERLGFLVPGTVSAAEPEGFDRISLPCVIKPSVDSGGSSFVFFARNRREGELYAAYLAANGKQPIAQEYISHDAGEFTVGVLSAPDGAVLGAIAMKRAFPAKISVLARGTDFLISSGTSQGHIGEYQEICSAAREMARALGSTGPMNIQGRLRPDGRFVPFEINPRFSATTYLRAMAGFNEVDHYVKLLLGNTPAAPLSIRPGWYLRSLTELYVPDEEIRR